MTSNAPYLLYVDDEVANLHAFQLAFEDHFSILTANSADEAMEKLSCGQVAVLLTDERMPNGTGSQLCVRARSAYPNVARMIVTAYSDITAVLDAVNQGHVSRYFLKPWREDEMVDAIKTALDLHKLTSATQDLQVRLMQREQQATAAVLLRKVLHELGNPAAALRSNLGYLSDAMGDLPSLIRSDKQSAVEATADLAQVVREAVGAVDDMVQRIEILRAGDVRPAASSRSQLDEAVAVAAALVRNSVSQRAQLDVDIKDRLTVAVERSRLTQIATNLLTNACEARRFLKGHRSATGSASAARRSTPVLS